MADSREVREGRRSGRGWRWVGGLVLLLGVVVGFVWVLGRAVLVSEYGRLVDEAGVGVLAREAEVYDWDGRGEEVGLVGEEVDFGAWRVRVPWEIERITMIGRMGVHGEGFMLFGWNGEYGMAQFEEDTADVSGYVERARATRPGLIERIKNRHSPRTEADLGELPDGGLKGPAPMITREQWERVRGEERWAAYWGEWAQRP